jgi:mannose-1-phosphate guanylyltransferase/mannose-6-phosphate isomerase
MQKVMLAKNIYFITNNDNYYNVLNQIKEIYPEFKKEQIIIEPKSLNTAPAISLAFKYLTDKIGIKRDVPVIILPSDHYIGKVDTFVELVKMAMHEVADNIGTIGITPTGPETGFGYIRKGEKTESYLKALQFKEKPDRKTAEKYITTGEYVWNGGIYIFNEKTFSEELQKYASEIYALYAIGYDTLREEFETLPTISIDFAVSEKSEKVVIFEGDFGWSDIGSFDVLSEIMQQENMDQKNHIRLDSSNVFIHSTTNRLIVASDVDDLIIIENDDCILVQKKGRSEDVKKVVEYLKENDCKEVDHNIIGYRPWGEYRVLVDEEKYKMKKVTVYPGASLSLQSHKHRTEHWVVVSGKAKIVNGESVLFFNENEGTYIAAGIKHRLSNAGDKNLEIIEVQTGKYLEEDDILRYDDFQESEK